MSVPIRIRCGDYAGQALLIPATMPGNNRRAAWHVGAIVAVGDARLKLETLRVKPWLAVGGRGFCLIRLSLFIPLFPAVVSPP